MEFHGIKTRRAGRADADGITPAHLDAIPPQS
jgi:hypothetical protein